MKQFTIQVAKVAFLAAALLAGATAFDVQAAKTLRTAGDSESRQLITSSSPCSGSACVSTYFVSGSSSTVSLSLAGSSLISGASFGEDAVVYANEADLTVYNLTFGESTTLGGVTTSFSTNSYNVLVVANDASVTKDHDAVFTLWESGATCGGYTYTGLQNTVNSEETIYIKYGGATYCWPLTYATVGNEQCHTYEGATFSIGGYSDSLCSNEIASISVTETSSDNYVVALGSSASSFKFYTVEYVSSSSGSSTSSSSSSKCFASSETVALEGGAMKRMEEVEVGDRILTMSADGSSRYSDVVFLPHALNDIQATFLEVSTAGGKSVRMTPEHILPTVSCASGAVQALSFASKVEVGQCVNTVDGPEQVTSVSKVVGRGVYTAVAEDEFIMVGGIMASSVGVSHKLGTAFYNIHRLVYKWFPVVLKGSALQWLHSSSVAVGLALDFVKFFGL